MPPWDFQQLGRTRASICGCSENWLIHGLHEILAKLLANVAESIPWIRDLAELDVHVLVSVISHVPALDANFLTARL